MRAATGCSVRPISQRGDSWNRQAVAYLAGAFFTYLSNQLTISKICC